MFWNLFAAQESKVLRRPLLWIELAVVSALAILIPLAIRMAPAEAGGGGMVWPGGVSQLLLMLAQPQIGGVVIIVLAGAVMSQEYSWRTAHHMLSHGVSRRAFLGATFASVALPLILVITVPLVVGSLAMAIMQLASSGSGGLGGLDIAAVGTGIAASIYSLLPFAAMAFLLAVVGRSPVLALGVGLGAVIGESLFFQIAMGLGGLMAEVARFMPSALAMGVTSPGTEMPVALLTGIQAYAGIAAYVVVLLGVAFVKFSRQDMTE